MSSKNNKFPGASLEQLIWLMSYFNSLKSFRATILKPDQYDVIEPFLQPQLEENPDFIKQFNRVNLLTLHLTGNEYRRIIAELAPDNPSLSNGRAYVWITFLGENMFVVMLNKVIYTRKKRENCGENATISTETKVDNKTLSIDVLKAKLRKALESESYEVAAELRDKINGLDEGTELQ
jgi:hypothetical protein